MPASDLGVSQVSAYLETEKDQILVSQASAYIELEKKQILVSQVSAYVEILEPADKFISTDTLILNSVINNIIIAISSVGRRYGPPLQ